MSMGERLERLPRTTVRPSTIEAMEVEQVPASEWEKWVATNDGLLVDVRQPDEWELGTLPGAELISMVDLPAAMTEMDPSTPTLLVCRSGSRSQRAAVFLAMSGFTSVANLAGGMKALGLQA